jgi:hypothetical protein
MIIYFIKIKNSISAVAHVKFGTSGNTLAQQTEQIIEIFGKDYVSLDELILFKGQIIYLTISYVFKTRVRLALRFGAEICRHR